LVLLIAIFCAFPKYQAEKYRWAARESIDKMAKAGTDAATQGDVLKRAFLGLDRAISLDPRDAQVWSDRAYVDSLLARVHPDQTRQLGESAFADADRAVGICPVFAEFWVRRGTGLDMQGRWYDGGSNFVRALQIAPMRADIWYYEAYHLSLKQTEYGPAMADADFSLRLDPGFLLAQLLRQELVLRLQQRQ
jgi:tetratricopeptide (TPR) repeat protein